MHIISESDQNLDQERTKMSYLHSSLFVERKSQKPKEALIRLKQSQMKVSKKSNTASTRPGSQLEQMVLMLLKNVALTSLKL